MIIVRKHSAPVSPLAVIIAFLQEPFTMNARTFLTVAIIAGTVIGSPVGLYV